MRGILFLIMFFTIAATNCEITNSEDSKIDISTDLNREFYQLKVYSFKTDAQVEATDKYLREAYLPGLKRQGIKSVGVFKRNMEESDSIQQTYVLIPFESMEQFLELEDALDKDQEYSAAGSDYINAAHDQPPYERIESTLLRAFSNMPLMQATKVKGPRSDRIYELRSYEAATEQYYKKKVDMFNAGGEIKLFDRLGFNAVFYAEVISGSNMPNLMYMTTFPDRSTRDALWKKFVDDPEWEKMKSIPKYANTVSHADIIFLYPTEYSDY